MQRATAQSKTGTFHDYGVAKAPPGFKPAGLTVCSDCSCKAKSSQVINHLCVLRCAKSKSTMIKSIFRGYGVSE
jgi:hypothetical protein